MMCFAATGAFPPPALTCATKRSIAMRTTHTLRIGPARRSATLAAVECEPDWVVTHRMSIKNERENMVTRSPVPRFVRVANVLTTTLLRAGVNLVGFGHHPT